MCWCQNLLIEAIIRADLRALISRWKGCPAEMRLANVFLVLRKLRFPLLGSGLCFPRPESWAERFRLISDKCFGMMVARDGIEPPTPAFSGLRSTI